MKHNINCLIVDDDETSRFILTNLANKLDEINLIGACESTKKAKQIIAEQDVNLLFLDIEMPEETGVELVKNLEKPMDVIFITSQTKHAIEAFEYDAVDYIVKPVDLIRLKKSIEKVVRRQKIQIEEVEESDFLIINENRKKTKFSADKILFIEAKPSYVTYHITSGNITTTGILKQIETDLDENIFIRIHRSYIINSNKIDSIFGNEIIVSGIKLPLSRKYKKAVSDKFQKNK